MDKRGIEIDDIPPAHVQGLSYAFYLRSRSTNRRTEETKLFIDQEDIVYVTDNIRHVQTVHNDYAATYTRKGTKHSLRHEVISMRHKDKGRKAQCGADPENGEEDGRI